MNNEGKTGSRTYAVVRLLTGVVALSVTLLFFYILQQTGLYSLFFGATAGLGWLFAFVGHFLINRVPLLLVFVGAYVAGGIGLLGGFAFGIIAGSNLAGLIALFLAAFGVILGAVFGGYYGWERRSERRQQ